MTTGSAERMICWITAAGRSTPTASATPSETLSSGLVVKQKRLQVRLQRAEYLLGKIRAKIIGFRGGAERREAASFADPHPGELQGDRPPLGARRKAHPVLLVELR